MKNICIANVKGIKDSNDQLTKKVCLLEKMTKQKNLGIIQKNKDLKEKERQIYKLSQKQVDNLPAEEVKSSEFNFKCEKCSEKFKIACLLKNHHQNLNELQKDDGQGIKCDQCDYKSKVKYGLNLHTINDHGIKPKLI